MWKEPLIASYSARDPRELVEAFKTKLEKTVNVKRLMVLIQSKINIEEFSFTRERHINCRRTSNKRQINTRLTSRECLVVFLSEVDPELFCHLHGDQGIC